MIRCENLTGEDLKRIGTQVADAFLSEPGCFSVLPAQEAHRLFTLIVEMGYHCGHLYTTGPEQAGFCIYWTKKQRPGMWVQLKMGLKMARTLSMKSGMAMMRSQKNWKPTEKRYAKWDNYVEVFLLAVRKEYQGQGYFRRMLSEPFALAEKLGTICVLDTDAQVKADKYAHVGMTVVDSRPQAGGITMFALQK